MHGEEYCEYAVDISIGFWTERGFFMVSNNTLQQEYYLYELLVSNTALGIAGLFNEQRNRKQNLTKTHNN